MNVSFKTSLRGNHERHNSVLTVLWRDFNVELGDGHRCLDPTDLLVERGGLFGTAGCSTCPTWNRIEDGPNQEDAVTLHLRGCQSDRGTRGLWEKKKKQWRSKEILSSIISFLGKNVVNSFVSVRKLFFLLSLLRYKAIRKCGPKRK